MIVFGGFPTNSTSPQNLNDVWKLLPSAALAGLHNWVQVHPSGTPPVPRFGQAAAYDPNSNRMIIFGGAEGRSSPCENDVWLMTNANGSGGASAWMQLTTAGGPPNPRYAQGSAYDEASNTLMLYGGNDCFNTTYSDYWILSHANGIGGTPTWTNLTPSSGGPGIRQVQNSVVYDPVSNELILFGGSNGSGTLNNDVWILSNANGSGGMPAWNELSTTGTPPAVRNGNSATYDQASNRLTIFAGNGVNNVFYGDTWVLTNANGIGGTAAWTQIAQSSVSFPTPRTVHTAVYDPTTNVMTIFGGFIGLQPLETIGVNDVLFLSHANGQ
jgi:hypothetical protein